MLDEDEEDLQRALALSRQEIDMEDEEADLHRAIQLSMQVAEIYLKIFHGHLVQTLLQKSFGRDEKPTLKKSSKSSNSRSSSSSSSRSSRGTYQDRVHIHVKGQPPVQEHLGTYYSTAGKLALKPQDKVLPTRHSPFLSQRNLSLWPPLPPAYKEFCQATADVHLKPQGSSGSL
ncbi:hypothetical protein H8959_015809 [Pygathrix nigripes]